MAHGESLQESVRPNHLWEESMKLKSILAATAFSALMATSAFAQTVGVSWSNFQEERWKTDEAAIVAALEAAGMTYISTDAQSSSSKQLSDVESLKPLLMKVFRSLVMTA